MNHCRLYSAWVKGGKSNIFAVPLWFRGQKDKVLSGFEDKKIKSSLVSRTKRGSTSIKQLALIFNILTQATFDYFSSE